MIDDANYRDYLDFAIAKITELHGIPPKYLVVPSSRIHWRHPDLITVYRADWPEDKVSVTFEEPE